LGQGVDAAFGGLGRAQWRAVVEEGAAIPFAVPAFGLAGCGQSFPMRLPSHGALAIATVLCKWRELLQRRDEKPGQPDTFAAALMPDAVHAIVPVAASHEWEVMRARCEADVQRPGAVLVKRGGLARRGGH